jgi:hypothetical protein
MAQKNKEKTKKPSRRVETIVVHPGSSDAPASEPKSGDWQSAEPVVFPVPPSPGAFTEGLMPFRDFVRMFSEDDI